MTAIDLLYYIENDDLTKGCFIDLHIVNNSVVGFYKTHTIKYMNIKGKEESYLFPTTFEYNNNKTLVLKSL